jgi:hypothetical protein
LALLGRLPSAHVDGYVMQASEKPAHEDQFPSTRLSASYGFRKETIPGVRHEGRDAPFSDVRSEIPEPLAAAAGYISCRLEGDAD